MRTIILTVLSVILLLAGCRTPQVIPPTGDGEGGDGSSTGDLAGSDWQISLIRQAPVLAGSGLTITFENDGSFGGYSGCNHYGGSYSTDGNRISLGEIAMTMMACVEPDGVMEQEAAFLSALGEAVTFQTNADFTRLILLNAAGETLIEADRRIPQEVSPEDLLRVNWSLWSLNGSSIIDGSTITILFSGADFEGFAGCRSYRGTYTAEGDDIHFTSIEMGDTDCQDDELLRQEEAYTDVLSKADGYGVDEQDGVLTLSIYAPDGYLVFQPAD